ncbi:MAG: HEAT repeat domain-containing protein [Candidatus Cloacimonetes bacterium]|nr:HEAT repeat domain-containing protein [Candidatus Cloacimonadota bacterium]
MYNLENESMSFSSSSFVDAYENFEEDVDWELRFSKLKKVCTSEVDLNEKIEYLRTSLNDSHRAIRYTAVNSLKDLDHEQVEELLIYALSDSDEWVRVRAVEGLGRISSPSVVEIFVKYLDQEENPKVKATLVKHLGSFQEDGLIPTIAFYLEDPDARVRANAVEGLGFYPSDKVLHIIKPFLEDDNARIRANVALILSKISDTKAQFTIDEMLDSKNSYQIVGAIFSLGELKDEKYLSKLFEYLNHPSSLIQRNVRDALVKYGIQIQGALLKEIRSRAGDFFTIGAVQVLGEIGDKKAIKTLVNLMESSEGEIRSFAEEAIDMICQRAENKDS